MKATGYVVLEDRGVLAVAGADARRFLQGLISNDVGLLTPGRAIYAALLTPQGKYLFDFMLFEHEDEIWLDVEAARRRELVQRLTMYRLRAKVTIEDRSDALAVVAILGIGAGLPDERGAARALGQGIVAIDPRLAALGARAVLPVECVGPAMAELGASPLPAAAYAARRLAHGVPASSDDLVVQKSLLLESNFVELAGVAFDKGCYVGQELTARTKYRALVRKRLLPVRVDCPLPAPGTPLLLAGREAGEMRSAAGDRGMALVRLDSLAKEMPVLEAGDSRVTPEWPAWLGPMPGAAADS
jgi:folate-binding protein YgfZ